MTSPPVRRAHSTTCVRRRAASATPERELVRRGQQHGVGAAELADRRAVGVDGQRRQPQPAARRPRRGAPAGRRPRRPGRPRRAPAAPGTAARGLREARADDDPVRVGAHAAGPGEVAGQGAAQLRAAARVAVAERLVRRGGQAPAGRGEPCLRAGTRTGLASRTAGRSAARAGCAAAALPVGALASAARSATCVPEPRRAVSQPSATSWPYASATVLRAMPRSLASAREDGSRVAGRSRPVRTASRRAASRPARTRRPASSRCRSIPEVGPSIRHESGPYPMGRWLA